MATASPSRRESSPAEVIADFSGGYNGYTNPTQTSPKWWYRASNAFTGPFGYLQRCRFAQVISNAESGTYLSLKYFADPTNGAFLLADRTGGFLYGLNTASGYARTQRLNPYIDPSGAGTTSLSGPWSREVLENICYEMNGTVKQAGRGANAATIESFGLDAPDASPSVTLSAGSIAKSVGRSYMYAWENANKGHIGAPSPATAYVAYAAQQGTIKCVETGTVSTIAGNAQITGVGTAFTQAWVGRKIYIDGGSGLFGRIISVQNSTHLTVDSAYPNTVSNQAYQIVDQSATHLRLYATADGGATYYRIQRNTFNPAVGLSASGLQFTDNDNSEPPNGEFTTETAQVNNVPPPIGKYLNEYQGRLCVFGVSGSPQTFYYSNQEATLYGLQQESFCPLNQVTLPIANGQISGMLEFPGSMIIWSDKQDMFRLTGLLSDNTVTGVAAGTSAAQQGASIARLPYNLGCANPFACEITPLGGIWLTSNAEVWLFTDRYAPRNIGRPVQDILDSITPANLSLCRMKYYHTSVRNWVTLAVPSNGNSFNDTLLVLDLDLLASNGSPSYFTFDMATNSPSWYVFKPTRVDSTEVVYESGGIVRFVGGQGTGGITQIEDLDYQAGIGVENTVTGTITFHPWGNDTPYVVKRPTWVRFNTNQLPSLLAAQGWTFQILGVDDDVYTFTNPLSLSLTPGQNDSSTLGGNPDFYSGLAFRHSPELFRMGGVNWIAGRRLQFVVNFPSGTGTNYQLRNIQLGFGMEPPS